MEIVLEILESMQETRRKRCKDCVVVCKEEYEGFTQQQKKARGSLEVQFWWRKNIL
jgi:hypothetical protein